MESNHFISVDETMEKLKVLFLTYAYPPQKYPRAVQISHLAQYLCKDFSLKIITSLPKNDGDQSLLIFTPLDNVHYTKNSAITKIAEDSRGYRIKKAILPDLYYFWHFDLYRKTIEIIEKFGADVIVTFGQPMSSHIAGLKLKEKYPYLKWIAHFSDPWVDNLFNDYNLWLRFMNMHYQDAVFNKADKLIFTSQETINLVMHGYLLEVKNKTLCFPHVFNKNFYVSKKKRTEKDFLYLRYLGNFYGSRQPECLLRALRELPKALLDVIRVELIGSSTIIVNDLIKKYELERAVFTKPAVSYLDSLSLMQESDLLLIIDAPTKISPFLPSKLIDYIGANRPIFGITPSGTSQKLIEEMGFLTADPNNHEEIAKKLSEMLQNIKNKRISKIPEHILKRYSVENVGGDMNRILKKIINNS